MSNTLYRNEILVSGEIINAYAYFEWDGRFLGSVCLKDKRYESGNKQSWMVDYIDGMQNATYKTSIPAQIIPIIDIG